MMISRSQDQILLSIGLDTYEYLGYYGTSSLQRWLDYGSGFRPLI